MNSYQERNEHNLIGIMSGTSLDGIDTALVRICTNDVGEIKEVKLKAFLYVPFSEELRTQILNLCSVETAKLDDLVIMHSGISEWYAFAVKRLLSLHNISASDVDAICSHGQTIWHAPSPVSFPGPEGDINVKSTLQIGSLSVLAERTGIPVIGDFRARDMAAGGEGAPLVPYMDALLFSSDDKGRILQNIGGIGNATILPAKTSKQPVFAFDTGPGNMVIDTLVSLHSLGQQKYDSEGEIAALGAVDNKLLDSMLEDPFFKKLPPKSTGREDYGVLYAKKFLSEGERRNLSFYDIIATATALTAKSITNSYKQFVYPTAEISELIISGGGTYNKTLMQMIKEYLPASIEVKTAGDFGVPDDAKEAVAFAVLGHETLMGRPSNLPEVTGAKHPVILGNICF
ncbi:anhydro-N-acetylmuramic acid kinase [Bacillus sp. M6-12]|nr:anhydro-N-acetylmuramic acid kinase [Bacillus sp. M6-12]